MKTVRTIAKGLSVLCLLGAVGVMLVLQLCSSNTGIFNNTASGNPNNRLTGHKATEASFSCKENGPASNAPADMGVTSILTPIISEYLSGLLPRLLR